MLRKKTRIDFQIAAFKKIPRKWPIHNCSICGYECGYVFDDDAEKVAYDSGCYCIGIKNINEISWNRLANYYNMQTNEDTIKMMNEFWGFKDDRINNISYFGVNDIRFFWINYCINRYILAME